LAILMLTDQDSDEPDHVFIDVNHNSRSFRSISL
jgi:hypothetical protein